MTYLEPIQEPTVAEATNKNKVNGSTFTTVMKISASNKHDNAWLTFKVPGNFRSSSSCLVTFTKSVVGAKAPIPNVSKKSVINPIPMEIGMLSSPKSFRCLKMSLPKTLTCRPMNPINTTNNTVFIL
ncbi:hypothetical protein RU95_GL001931 [Enterococcus avium]|nr:hypothetical protein RU95_GL001931 [Enterococcus avium]